MEKKVLFVATVGGFVTQFERNNVEILQKMGYEVHSAANFQDPVYCMKEQELRKSGIILHQIDIEKSPFMLKQNFRAWRQLRKIIRKENILMIHCHTPVGGLLGRLAGISCRRIKPVILYTAHGFHFYKGAPLINWIFYYTVERWLARFTDCLITINQEDYERAGRFKLRRGGAVFRIPGEGLHLEDYQPASDEEREQLRKRLGITQDTYFILSVGELSGNKNHRAIIKKVPEMMKRIPDKKVLYGICGDGFFREELEELISSMGLADHVKLFGHRNDIRRMLACADCFLFPSVREGLGMAALEAMAMEVPVVAADNRGSREYMQSGVNGLTCNPKKAEEFVEAVATIHDMPAKERKMMARAGRRTTQKFTVDKAGTVMEEVYRKANDAVSRVSQNRNVRIHVYNILVNRKPVIRYQYHRFRAKVHGTGRIKAWLYLLFLNLRYFLGDGSLDGKASGRTRMEEKNLLLDKSESQWAAKGSVEEYVKKLAEYDVISFDVFDTLLFRPFSAPTDLFFLIGEKLGYLDFERIRREAEYQARQLQYRKKQHYEVTLQDIYELLEKEAGIDSVKGQELEFAVETELCMPNPFLQLVFSRLIEMGKQVIVVSDMYLEHNRMEELLKKCGYSGYAACYVSNQYGKTKIDGSLYAMVRADMGEDLSYIHIGDNYHSDVLQANKAGWQSIHYPNVNAQGEEFRASDMSRIIGSAYRGIVNIQLHNGLEIYTKEYEYGFAYGGLLVLGYCHFIHEYAVQNRVDKILFLARDGDILKQVYDFLYPEEQTLYVYWSRLAAVKMTAGYFKYDYLRRFLHHKVNQNIPLSQILHSMDLSDMAAQMEKESGLKREEPLTEKNVKNLKEYLLAHWEEVLRHYEEALEAGKKYFEDVLHNVNKACAVDIGWAGSGAMALCYLVREVWKLPCELTGVIAGTNTVHNAEPDASEAFLQSGTLISYLYHQGMNRDLWKYHDLNQGDNLYLELLMSSPSPSFQGFAWDDEGKVKLLFGEPEKNSEGIREIQRGVLDFARIYCKAFEKYPYMLNISGRDAYAPFLVAGSNDRVYLKEIYGSFELKVNI